MAKQGSGKQRGDSGPAAKIAKITAIIVALTGLVTAIVHFRDSIPWLTPVATIEVTPSPINLDVGDRIQTVATAKDSKGNALGKKASWSSSNPGVAEVEVDGNLTAKGPGETTVVASMGFIKGVALAHVRHVTVASVEVFPPATTLEVDGHLKFDATPYDSDGNYLLGRPVRWSSENSSVAAAEESSGDVTGRSVAAVKVTADCEGKLNVALVTVSAKAVSTGASGAMHSQRRPHPGLLPRRAARKDRHWRRMRCLPMRWHRKSPSEGESRPATARQAFAFWFGKPWSFSSRIHRKSWDCLAGT